MIYDTCISMIYPDVVCLHFHESYFFVTFKKYSHTFLVEGLHSHIYWQNKILAKISHAVYIGFWILLNHQLRLPRDV